MPTVAKKLQQVEDARAVLQSVKELIEIERAPCDRRTVRGEFLYETFSLAWRAVRDADTALAKAKWATYDTAGVTEVDVAVFELVRGFRQIGPRKLSDLLKERQDQSRERAAS